MTMTEMSPKYENMSIVGWNLDPFHLLVFEEVCRLNHGTVYRPADDAEHCFKAVDEMIELGYLRKTHEGVYEPTDSTEATELVGLIFDVDEPDYYCS